MRKKLLFITTRIFWPKNSGRKVSLYYYCKGLHEKYGYDIYLYSFLEEGQEFTVAVPDFIKEVRIASNVCALEKILNLLLKSLYNDWPLQCSLYYSFLNRKRILAYFEEIVPDVVICDMIRTAPYIFAFSDKNCIKILDLDDLLSKRYRKQMNSAFSDANITGQYSRKIPAFINSLIKSKVIKNKVLSFESSRVEKAEVAFSDLYDSVIFVSEKETNYFNQITGSSKAITITMGVDVDYYSNELAVVEEKNVVSFVGNFNVAANIDTLKMIANEILPLSEKKICLKVIGSCPQYVKQEYANRDDLTFCGEVDDIRPVVKSTSVFLAPIAYGSGINTKILEAMAMGMPVVTNTVGAEGICAENGKHFLVGDSYKEIMQMTADLINDNERRATMGEQAKKLIVTKYTWENIWNDFSKIGL